MTRISPDLNASKSKKIEIRFHNENEITKSCQINMIHNMFSFYFSSNFSPIRNFSCVRGCLELMWDGGGSR
jgi:hypothetical protein